MENEFNPTQEDLSTIEDKILDLKSKKSKVVKMKMSKQLEASELKDKLERRETLNSEEYQRLYEERKEGKEMLTKFELEIRELNDALNKYNRIKHEIMDHLRTTSKMDSAEMKALQHIRNLQQKYVDFSKDHTRVASMRTMAAKFADELTSLLKKF